MGKTKPTWGGARQGAGRKPLGKVSIFARLPEAAAVELKKRAKDENTDLGNYLIDKLNLL